MKTAVRIILLVLTLACVVFIFSNSLRNARSSSEQSGRVTQFIADVYESITGKIINPARITHVVRKLAHFSEFALLGLLGTASAASVFGTVYGKIHVILFWGLASAVTDEYLQRFSTGRSASVTDVMLDFSGFFVGLLWRG